MKQRLINHINSIQDPALRKTCETILTIDKFFTWPASLSFHHAYEGGLLAHTVEVCDIALHSHAGSPGTPERTYQDSKDILIAAALWHDVMKVEEYRVTGDTLIQVRAVRIPESEEYPYAHWIKDEARVRMFGHHEHIIAGAREFHLLASANKVRVETIDAITHCILAHHGRKDWGSPVEPQTLEALILHQADNLSAKFGATK